MLIDVHQSDEMGNVYTLREPIYYRELVVPVERSGRWRSSSEGRGANAYS